MGLTRNKETTLLHDAFPSCKRYRNGAVWRCNPSVERSNAIRWYQSSSNQAAVCAGGNIVLIAKYYHWHMASRGAKAVRLKNTNCLIAKRRTPMEDKTAKAYKVTAT